MRIFLVFLLVLVLFTQNAEAFSIKAWWANIKKTFSTNLQDTAKEHSEKTNKKPVTREVAKTSPRKIRMQTLSILNYDIKDMAHANTPNEVGAIGQRMSETLNKGITMILDIGREASLEGDYELAQEASDVAAALQKEGHLQMQKAIAAINEKNLKRKYNQ